jgi:pimeloyl-ACP methyl ester carboxylesterase
VHETQFAGDSGPRMRRTGFIEVGGYPHLVRVSEPDGHDPDTPVVHNFHFLGLGEVPERGMGKRVHDALASARPSERTVSIATDGVNMHGYALPRGGTRRRQFADMASDRQRIMASLAGTESPVDVTGVSMGSILAVLTAHQNMHTPEGQQMNVRRLNLLSPGVFTSDVPKEETFRPHSLEPIHNRVLTFAAFLGHLSIDAVREGFHHPDARAESLRGALAMLEACTLRSGRAAAVGGNVLQIMTGIPWGVLKEVAAEYPMHVLTGSKDTARETEQWNALQRFYPNNVHLEVLSGRGHTMILHTEDIVGRLTD